MVAVKEVGQEEMNDYEAMSWKESRWERHCARTSSGNTLHRHDFSSVSAVTAAVPEAAATVLLLLERTLAVSSSSASNTRRLSPCTLELVVPIICRLSNAAAAEFAIVIVPIAVTTRISQFKG
jgi:hypothetical protein